MTFGGSGPQPVVIPKDHRSGPPIRVPDQPPGNSRLFFEQVVKWGGIVLIVAALALFAYTAIDGFEEDLTDAQISRTQVALEATRDASR